MTTYREWRRELTNIQERFDALEEAHWDKLIDSNPPLTKEEAQKVKDEYAPERQKMVDELNAHYKREADFT